MMFKYSYIYHYCAGKCKDNAIDNYLMSLFLKLRKRLQRISTQQKRGLPKFSIHIIMMMIIFGQRHWKVGVISSTVPAVS